MRSKVDSMDIEMWKVKLPYVRDYPLLLLEKIKQKILYLKVDK